MTATELDRLYTCLCETMTALGEERSVPFLCRFALLAITRAENAAAVERMIDDARRALGESAA